MALNGGGTEVNMGDNERRGNFPVVNKWLSYIFLITILGGILYFAFTTKSRFWINYAVLSLFLLTGLFWMILRTEFNKMQYPNVGLISIGFMIILFVLNEHIIDYVLTSDIPPTLLNKPVLEIGAAYALLKIVLYMIYMILSLEVLVSRISVVAENGKNISIWERIKSIIYFELWYLSIIGALKIIQLLWRLQ